MDLLRYLFERPRVGVDSDVELVRIRPSKLVYKETVSSPDVDDYPFAGILR